MRIAVWHNLPSGGGKRALYDHIRGLVARGHHIESWCPTTADQEFLRIGDLVPEHILPFDENERLSGRALAARLAGGGTLIPAKLKAMDQHSRRCAREIERSGFDLLLAGSSLLFAVTGIARYVTCPALLYLQEPWRPLYEALPRLPWPALSSADGLRASSLLDHLSDAIRLHGLRLQAREELTGIRAYDRVLANSYFSRESILRAYGITAEVCYLGVDTNTFQDCGRTRERLVVGIGAFVPQKRVEIIIQAVARTTSPRPALVWIGNKRDPHYFRTLLELAEQKGIKFIPYHSISNNQLVRLLNEAAVMAYAPRLEPFGYAPLEAAACGLPVVAQAEGGVRETVVDGETGYLVANEGELSASMDSLLRDEKLARRMGEAARRHAESTWSLSAATDRLEAHLAELVQGDGHSPSSKSSSITRTEAHPQ
jgi:glycosyltransferase involved in cell wall biosynthesis